MVRRRSSAKLVSLQTSYDEIYNEMLKRPVSLKELEADARDRHGDMNMPGLFAREGGEPLKAMLALQPWFEPLNEKRLRELAYVNEMAT